MEEGSKTTEKVSAEGRHEARPTWADQRLPSTEFVKVEKNLASLGFFTPSSKRTRNDRSKTVSVTVMIEGKRIEAKATIAPTALFGLPITADQDKWLALHKILSDVQARDGQVTNPVSFSSAELLALLKIYKDSGKNYRDVSEWLDVMVGTTIISEGAVYIAGKRTFGKDTFHVFDRAVSFGKQLPDGSVADKNYVWLSSWQLQNINSYHQLPIDLDVYRQLKTFIAKALVPLLQIWLYASRDEGVFEKKYDELCQTLNIRRWDYISKIREKLGPSLDELKQYGYLADWQIERTSDKRGYKILFFHGEKFHRDRRERLSRKRTPTSSPAEQLATTQESQSRPSENAGTPSTTYPRYVVPPPQVFDPQVVAEFTRRGITEQKALELLANRKAGQDVVAQLEQSDELIKIAGFKIRNPAGFHIHQIERNIPIPEGFETSAKRREREDQEEQERQRRAAEEARQELEDEYERYCHREVDRYITDNPSAFEALRNAKALEEGKRYQSSWGDTTLNMATWAARGEIRKQLFLLTFEEFVAQKKQGTDFSLKPVAVFSAVESERVGATEKEMTAEKGNADTVSSTPPPAEVQIEPTADQAVMPSTDVAVIAAEPEVPTPLQSSNSESPAPETAAVNFPLLVIPEPGSEFPGDAAEQGIV